jgi:hypothetical protein
MVKMLRIELAFYIGCLNLYEQPDQMGEPKAFPEPAAAGERKCAFQGLYDVCLALTMKQRIVSNRARADGKPTFQLIEGQPRQTSYGVDSCYSIFETFN